MGMTAQQRANAQQVLDDMNIEVNGILEERSNVEAALRLDLVYPDSDHVHPLQILLDAHTAAVVHCNALITALTG